MSSMFWAKENAAPPKESKSITIDPIGMEIEQAGIAFQKKLQGAIAEAFQVPEETLKPLPPPLPDIGLTQPFFYNYFMVEFPFLERLKSSKSVPTSTQSWHDRQREPARPSRLHMLLEEI